MKQMRILWLLTVLTLTVSALLQGDAGARASQAQQQQQQGTPRVVRKTPAAGSMKVNPQDGLTYVWISAGTFTMGRQSI
jgi:hypothetical protein